MGLYPFQQTGARWLSQTRHAYLADVMGLGKTPQAIVGASMMGYARTLVIAPAVVVGTWELEINLWNDWRRDFRVISYDKYVRSINTRTEVAQYNPELLICDEAHFMKGISTKRTKSILGGLAQRTDATWLLSGTPMPNGVHELWTPFRYLRPDLLQKQGITSYYGWLNKFCQWVQGDYGPRIFGAKNTDLLRSMLFESGFMLRRTFADVEIELPKLNLQRLQLKGQSIDPTLEMLLDLMQDEMGDTGELPPDSPHTSTARRLLGQHKARLVTPILFSELSNDDSHNVVVFAYHLDVLDYVEKALARFGVLRIDGSTPKAKRTELQQQFQAGKGRVFLCQLTAGGVGITLTRAKDAVIIEPSWVPADNLQAIGRIRRIGQVSDTVTARMAVLSGTLDDPIQGINIRKMLMQSQTIDGTGEKNASNF